MTRVTQELSSVPMGSMIANIAKGIAEGQWELDKTSMTVAELMSGQRLVRDIETGELLDEYDQTLADGKAPRVVDSRVFFGYSYERKEGNAASVTVVVEDGVVTGFTLNDAGYYDSVPDVEVTGDGEGAEVDVVTVNGNKITGITVKEGGSGYKSHNTRVNISGGLKASSLRRTAQKLSMMELGFTPNFYQFVDTVIEIKISVTMTQNTDKTNRSSRKSESKNSSNRSYVGWGRRRSHGAHGWYTGGGWSWGGSNYNSANTTSVDAQQSSKYSYSVEGSSMVRTKLVPIPPPAILEERIRELIETEREYQDRMANEV